MFAAVRSWRSPLLALAVVVASLPAARADDDDDVSSMDVLPPNVLLYISIPDVPEFHTRFADCNYGRMVNDAAMAEVRAEVMAQFEKASQEAEGEIGMSLSDLLAIPSGEAAFALLQPPGEKLGMVLLLDVGEHQEQLDKLLAKADEEITTEGVLTKSTEEFEGTEITVYTNENAGPNEPFNSACYFSKDSTFVMASSTSLLESVLVRWDGDHDRTFAGDPTFSYILGRCTTEGGDEPAMCWYFDPIGMVKAAMATAGPEVGMQGAMMMGFLPVLGIDRLKGMGGTLDLATEDYDMESHTLIYVNQPATGVLRAFRFPPTDLSPPKFIPATVPNVNAFNWDVPGAYAAVEEVWDFFTAPGTFAKVMDDAEESPDGPGLHPKDDFIDLLDGRIYMIQELPEDLAGGEQQKMAFLFGVNDQQKMEDVITKVMNMDGANVSVRDFQGVKIYESDDAGGAPISPASAIANNTLFFATDVVMLESLLRGSDESLVESEGYQSVAEHFPGEVSTLSYQDQSATMEAVYGLIRQGLEQEGEFDASKLPEFEAISKYFGLSGSYSLPDDNGVYMMGFSLKMEE
jgi:hypothetical protein